MAESAPLLVDPEQDDSGLGTDNNSSPTQSKLPARLVRRLKVVNLVNLVASGLVLALLELIATEIVIDHVPAGSSQWSAMFAIRSLAPWIIASLILSVINVAVNIYNLINVVVDVVLASGIIPLVFRLIDAVPWSEWCTRYNFPPYPNRPYPIPPGSPPERHKLPVDPKCEEWKPVVQSLMVAASVFAGGVGAIYFSLAILRTIAIIRSKFWEHFTSQNFRLAPGEITFSISLKLSRQEGGSSVGVLQGEENSPATNRGPVYI